jgi:hypothetical protein
MKFIIVLSFPLASSGIGGFILVGQPGSGLSALVRGEWPRRALYTSGRGPKRFLERERTQFPGEQPANREKDRTHR